jgi:hypothetical protein
MSKKNRKMGAEQIKKNKESLLENIFFPFFTISTSPSIKKILISLMRSLRKLVMVPNENNETLVVV